MSWLRREAMPKQRVAVHIQIRNEKGKVISMDQISSDKKRTLTGVPVDAKGRPASIDGIIEWSVAPAGMVALFPASDGKTCDAVWMGPGTCTVTATADADTGSGVQQISGSVQLEALPNLAVAIQISVGPEVDL